MATAIAVAGIAAKGRRVRFYVTFDMVNLLEREKREPYRFQHSSIAAEGRIEAREQKRKRGGQIGSDGEADYV